LKPSKFALCGSLYFKLRLNAVLIFLFPLIHDLSVISKYGFSNSLILAGNVYQLRKDISLQRGSVFGVQRGGQIPNNPFARSRSNIEQRVVVYGLGVRNLSKVNRACVHYRSEEYDIDETKVDPVVSDEGNSASLSPWWKQLPKRWLIVLLCFTAFLLCNMDRVSILFRYSI
jgi:hypothetical protein